MKRIIAKNYKPFSAVVALALFAVLVGGYILVNQRLRLPFIDEKPVRLNVTFDNAQAVTPGQGQTAQIAGVEIGRIGEVKLRDGAAIIGLDIEKEFADRVRTDARALLRPRTGLKDMYVQIFPGTSDKQAPEGFTIPLQNTATDVDLDEILAQLDRRTRDYVKLLAHGAGEGLKDRGTDLARVFARFTPTFRDLARVNRAVARERVALRRLVTSLSDLNGELARRPEDLTRLVSASSATFGAFASEEDNLRDTIAELPDTLARTSAALRQVRPFARELGPTTRALVPAVRALDRANDQLLPLGRQITPVVRDEIRPFVRAARPVTSDLAVAARSLAADFPELTRSVGVLNTFFNMLARNPGGSEAPDKADREEGYLFWLAWVTHQTTNLINIDDANGPMRPLFLTGTCGTLTSFVSDQPALEFGLNLTPILAQQCGNPQTPSIDLQAIQDLLNDILPPAARREAKSRKEASR